MIFMRSTKCQMRAISSLALFVVYTTTYLILAQHAQNIRATTLAESINDIKNIIEMSTTLKPSSLQPVGKGPESKIDNIDQAPTSREDHDKTKTNLAQGEIEKRAFVTELLKMLHEQYGTTTRANASQGEDHMQSRQGQLGFGPDMMHSLLNAIGADGDMRRLVEWIRNTFNVASIPDLTTQFVVSKLGSVNCPALLKPDKEESLIPRFLLFNEHYVDVPFELSINPNAEECIAHGKFDPRRKTIILIHGYLTGYTIVDGITNIKNRLLDLNRLATERATENFAKSAEYHLYNGSSYVYTDDLNFKIRSQLYNVIIVDWFNGANPTPRSNYIMAAVNAQVVGRLIARFLSALVVQCGTPAGNLQIIAHSLGCHVSGFTGKAMNAAGHRLGKITHLDPVGLCFGRLFSQPRFRLRPNDALETQAVHVSLNIFDNPLDGAHSNFLVNGGRDQVGCGGQSEVKNSTTSSVSLLFDPAARFGPCSHLRALALFEDDHSSEPGHCQLVGYRCQNFDKFLAGKCGECDATNSQCRLMGLPPISMHFRKMTLLSQGKSPHSNHLNNFYQSDTYYDLYSSASLIRNQTITAPLSAKQNDYSMTTTTSQPFELRGSSFTANSPAPTLPPMTSTTRMFGAPSYLLGRIDESARRSDRSLTPDKRERIAQAVEKLRTETRTVLTSGWTNLRVGIIHPPTSSTDKTNDDDTNENEPDALKVMSGTSTLALPPGGGQKTTQRPENELPDNRTAEPSNRAHDDLSDQAPLGSQKLPSGSLNMPQYFLGTGALSPYCVNYYQFRVLVSDFRLQRILRDNGLGSNRLLPQLSQHRGGIIAAASTMQQRVVKADGREMLHLTIKLTDTRGRFFKGFSMLENARTLTRVMNNFAAPPSLKTSTIGLNEPMVELTMLLNTTRPEPQRIGEAIISYYFHQVVLADRVEINYMSNISPEIRAKYSSVLCPVAINDRHQLVKYIECDRVGARK